MFKLNDESKRNILNNTGLTVEQITAMDVDDLDQALKEKTGKKPLFKVFDNLRLIGRGSVYLALGRLISTSKIDKRIAKI